ncbi:syntaxin-binding protein 1 [Trichonephila inaurata madagascariensis]|uniref:Syntaxin-binding protein 1 n=1 Tax=Trichonephila inaurata madagascariensis TaxID=2747483 RepID=A0A8X6YE38_9ARAC|nr:syntaxin-binding protein 1 [Trichonephila inaurata madagascariensis]
MSWNKRFIENRGIRNMCRKKIMDDILIPLKRQNEWKLLIVDDFSMKILTLCFKTYEVMACNIALIEYIEDIREQMPFLPALYILTPSIQSITYLEQDLEPDKRKYKEAHLVFLSDLPDHLFNDLCEHINPEMVMTFKEIDVCFLPIETQVYSLNEPQFFQAFYDAYEEIDMDQYRKIAKKLISLFSTLKEIPIIRYRRAFVKNLILAETIQEEIKRQENTLKHISNTKKNKCQLLILDRGFDCISPVIHEFTFQAMAYDLLDLTDDIYEYALEVGRMEAETQSTPLTEEDPLWCKLRHEHIANVARIVQNMIESDELMQAVSNLKTKFKSLPSLGEAVKEHLLQKSNESFYSYRHMANILMKIYCAGINVISQLEQDLAARKSIDDKQLKNIESTVMSILSNEKYNIKQKLRLLLLFIFYKKGITKQNFDQIVNNSGIDFSTARTITNVLHLDIDIFKPGHCCSIDPHVDKYYDDSDIKFKQSRWNPILRNTILSIIDGSLSKDHFPFLNTEMEQQMIPSERTGYWCADKASENASRLIVLIVGGVTYSEMRCAYEVMRVHKGWEIFVGGDAIITPKTFLEKLDTLRCFFST